MLTPYLTYKFRGTSGYGQINLVYSLTPFLFVLALLSLDTAFFRFIQKKEGDKEAYGSIFVLLLTSTTIVTAVILMFRQSIASFIELGTHPDYIAMCAFIIALDALSSLPFARLRYENRPIKFAVIRISGIALNIALTFFFLSILPQVIKSHPNSILGFIYKPGYGVGYYLFANVIQNAFQFLILSGQLRRVRWTLSLGFLKEILVYSLPLTVAGLGGMINETFDRILLVRRLPLPPDQAAYQVGVYGACYKLSILITLFVQAFRMGAEPFFFKQALQEDAPRVYARVMKFFVITISLMFLFVSLYIDIWKYFIQDPKMWDGLKVVPVLLLANMFLGIYYNLSIWYRLSKKTSPGAYITLIGAGITLLINYLFIPAFGYMASAWATFLCYGSMMLISFVWGQKVYRVPYAWKKLLAFMVIAVFLYFVHHFLIHLWSNRVFSVAVATLFTGGYAYFILRVERKEFQRLPYIGKFLNDGAIR
jgi:O-antigen/teichoic acid export membrane protein